VTSGSPGSAYEPRADTARRLRTWRLGCQDGLSVADIAAALGVAPGTLQRSVERARAAGHPDAVIHPHMAGRMPARPLRDTLRDGTDRTSS
jgi:transposase-like protein